MVRSSTLVLILVSLLGSQEKKRTAREDSRVLGAVPFGIEPGKTSRILLRGLKLDEAKEVRLGQRVRARILRKGRVSVPNQQEVGKVGDSEIEIETHVPADVRTPVLEVVVVTPTGETRPYQVLLDRPAPVQEKEPNDGFDQAQVVSVGTVVQGLIHRPQDCDVFRFAGRAGQVVLLEIEAAQRGSPLDSFLRLHDSSGKLLALADDHKGSPDSRIETRLPANGDYLICVSDAHEQGGPTHVYRLAIRVKSPGP